MFKLLSLAAISAAAAGAEVERWGRGRGGGWGQRNYYGGGYGRGGYGGGYAQAGQYSATPVLQTDAVAPAVEPATPAVLPVTDGSTGGLTPVTPAPVVDPAPVDPATPSTPDYADLYARRAARGFHGRGNFADGMIVHKPGVGTFTYANGAWNQVQTNDANTAALSTITGSEYAPTTGTDESFQQGSLPFRFGGRPQLPQQGGAQGGQGGWRRRLVQAYRAR